MLFFTNKKNANWTIFFNLLIYFVVLGAAEISLVSRYIELKSVSTGFHNLDKQVQLLAYIYVILPFLLLELITFMVSIVTLFNELYPKLKLTFYIFAIIFSFPIGALAAASQIMTNHNAKPIEAKIIK